MANSPSKKLPTISKKDGMSQKFASALLAVRSSKGAAGAKKSPMKSIKGC